MRNIGAKIICTAFLFLALGDDANGSSPLREICEDESIKYRQCPAHSLGGAGWNLKMNATASQSTTPPFDTLSTRVPLPVSVIPEWDPWITATTKATGLSAFDFQQDSEGQDVVDVEGGGGSENKVICTIDDEMYDESQYTGQPMTCPKLTWVVRYAIDGFILRDFLAAIQLIIGICGSGAHVFLNIYRNYNADLVHPASDSSSGRKRKRRQVVGQNTPLTAEERQKLIQRYGAKLRLPGRLRKRIRNRYQYMRVAPHRKHELHHHGRLPPAKPPRVLQPPPKPFAPVPLGPQRLASYNLQPNWQNSRMPSPGFLPVGQPQAMQYSFNPSFQSFQAPGFVGQPPQSGSMVNGFPNSVAQQPSFTNTQPLTHLNYQWNPTWNGNNSVQMANYPPGSSNYVQVSQPTAMEQPLTQDQGFFPQPALNYNSVDNGTQLVDQSIQVQAEVADGGAQNVPSEQSNFNNQMEFQVDAVTDSSLFSNSDSVVSESSFQAPNAEGIQVSNPAEQKHAAVHIDINEAGGLKSSDNVDVSSLPVQPPLPAQIPVPQLPSQPKPVQMPPPVPKPVSMPLPPPMPPKFQAGPKPKPPVKGPQAVPGPLLLIPNKAAIAQPQKPMPPNQIQGPKAPPPKPPPRKELPQPQMGKNVPKFHGPPQKSGPPRPPPGFQGPSPGGPHFGRGRGPPGRPLGPTGPRQGMPPRKRPQPGARFPRSHKQVRSPEGSNNTIDDGNDRECSLHGTWISKTTGLRITLWATENNLQVQAEATEMSKFNQVNFWKGTALLSPEDPTSITLIFQKDHSHQQVGDKSFAAIFVGQCAFCTEGNAIQGTWSIFPEQQTCLSDFSAKG